MYCTDLREGDSGDKPLPYIEACIVRRDPVNKVRGMGVAVAVAAVVLCVSCSSSLGAEIGVYSLSGQQWTEAQTPRAL